MEGAEAERPAPAPEAPRPALPRGWWVAAGLAALLLLVAWREPLGFLWASWRDADGYYEHGPLVLVACGWVLWRDRARLRPLASTPRSASVGLAGLALAGWFLLAGALEGSFVLQQWALVLALACAGLILAGARPVLGAWFPLTYALLFAIPLPTLVLDRLTMQLRLLAAELTWSVLDGVGIAVVQAGATLHFGRGVTVTVDELCSGLRSTIALLGLAVFVAWLQTRWWKSALMLALTLPVAVLANAARILVLTWLILRGTPAPPESFAHGATGFMVYLLALGLLLLIQALPERAPPPASPPAADPGPDRLPARWASGALLGLLFAAAIAVTLLSRERPVPTAVTPGIPREIGPWAGTDLRSSPEVEAAFLTDDHLTRRYQRRPDEPWVEVFVLHATATSTHQPDSCYTLEGYRELERGLRRLGTPQGELEVNRAVVDKGEGPLLLYFWHRLEGRHVPTFFELRLESLFERVVLFKGKTPATTLRLATPVLGDLPAAEARIAEFARGPLGEVLARVP